MTTLIRLGRDGSIVLPSHVLRQLQVYTDITLEVEVTDQGSLLLNRVPTGEMDPLENFIGSVESGIPDWADNHDIYLGEGINNNSSQSC